MNILILGGTGAMGISLTEILSKEKNTIYVTTRKQIKSDDNVKYIQGNALDDIFLESLLKLHFDVIIDFMHYSTEKFEHRYKMFLEKTNHYFYLSSARVYADTNGKLITEESPRLLDVIKDVKYLSSDEYALAKARQENLLFNSDFENFTIIRPYITYNINRLQLGAQEKELWLNRVKNNNTVFFQKDIAEHFTTLTYGKDVAKAISLLINNKKANREAFNVTSSETHKWSDVLEMYLKKIYSLTGKKTNIYWENNSIGISNIRNKYQVKYDRLYDRKFDNKKIIRTCKNDFEFTKLDEGLEICLKYLMSEDVTFLRNIKWEGYCDYLQKYNSSITKECFKETILYTIYRYCPNFAFKLNEAKEFLINL